MGFEHFSQNGWDCFMGSMYGTLLEMPKRTVLAGIFSSLNETFERHVRQATRELRIWLTTRNNAASSFKRSSCDIDCWNGRPPTPSPAGFSMTSSWNSKAI